jgi:CHRD domain-containing protein
MRSKLLVAPAVLVGLAGCGGGGSGGGAATHTAAVPGSGSRPTQVYRVRLTGATETPRGAMHGIGAAIVAFHGDSLVCWRFAHLHGFTDATSAHIEAATGGPTGQTVIALSPGPRLHHQGCVAVSPALSRRIWARPRGYYVNIHSKQYPRGAVRAQL